MFSTPIFDTILAILRPYRQLVKGLISLSSIGILCYSTALLLPVVRHPTVQIQTLILLTYLLSLFYFTFVLERASVCPPAFLVDISCLLYLLRLLNFIPNSDSTNHFATTFFFLEEPKLLCFIILSKQSSKNLHKSMTVYSMTIFKLLNSTAKKTSWNRRW